MAKGLSRIALIVATIAVVMLISSCSDVTESSQSSNKEKSVTSLVGEIYHGDGYFILDEGEFSTVKKVVPQRSEVYLDNSKVLSIADASKKVAKLIGEVTTEQEDKVITKTYSIIHSDFSGIIRGLYDTIPYGDDVPEEDRKYKTLRDALFAGVKVRYEGAFETILTRTVVDEVVEISSLSVVDRYQLYSRDDRVGVVTKFDKDSHWFQIKLNTSDTVVKCKREDFTKLHNDNTIQMLHTLCSRCGR